MKLTFLEPEECAYPHGGQTRKGRAIFPDGKIRRVYAGIPDTYFSIPAHARIAGKYVRGYVHVLTYPKRDHDHAEYGELAFTPLPAAVR